MKTQRALRDHSRRGFAGILAITLIILVGTTLAVVASAFSADARRTRMAVADAQLRQLLTAGAVIAQAQLRAGNIQAEHQSADLPPELNDRAATLTVLTSVESGTATIVVEATVAADRARQVLRFAQRDGNWSITSAELD